MASLDAKCLEKPFHNFWLDSSYSVSLHSNEHWRQLRDSLCKELAALIVPQLEVEGRRDAILSLVGADFTRRFLADEINAKTDETISAESATNDEARAMASKCRDWLKTSADRMLNDAPAHLVQPVRDRMQRLVRSDLHRFLFLQQNNCPEIPVGCNRSTKADITARSTSLSTDCILKGVLAVASQQPSPLTSDTPNPRQSDTNEFISPASHSLGEAVVSVLRATCPTTSRGRAVRRKVTASLQGRTLPPPLRRHLWSEIMIGDHDEADIRRQFGFKIRRRCGDLKVKRATSSPLGTLINNDVLKICSAIPCGRFIVNNGDLLLLFTRSLNVYQVSASECKGASCTYDSYLIYWLVPLLKAFVDINETGDKIGSHKDTRTYELAMWLELLSTRLMPTWRVVKECSRRVVDAYKLSTPLLHDNVKAAIAKEDETSRNDLVMCFMKDSETSRESSDTVQTTLMLFIQRWIGEGFISILDHSAAMYVWDQLFLHKWNKDKLVSLSLAILLLLGDQLAVCLNYSQVKNVLFSRPCLLLTSDLRAAWNKCDQDVSSSSSSPSPSISAGNRRPTTAATPTRPASSLLVKSYDSAVSLPSLVRTPTPAGSRSPAPDHTPAASFDLYIDAAVNLPENTILNKVTGRFIDVDTPDRDFFAYPELTSDVHSPIYRFKQNFSCALPNRALVLLRLHAFVRQRGFDNVKRVVVGNCLHYLLDIENKPRYGPHCLQLYHGLPSDDHQLSDLTDSSLNDHYALPQCLLLLRIEPSSKTHLSCNDLQSYYKDFNINAKDSESIIGDSVEFIFKINNLDISEFSEADNVVEECFNIYKSEERIPDIQINN